MRRAIVIRSYIYMCVCVRGVCQGYIYIYMCVRGVCQGYRLYLCFYNVALDCRTVLTVWYLLLFILITEAKIDKVYSIITIKT